MRAQILRAPNRGPRVRFLPWLAWFAWLALTLVTVPALAQGLVAAVDREEIAEGDTLRLTLTLRGPDSGEGPDLKPLEKDFDVLGTQQASRLQIVNGQADASKEWTVALAPKRPGTLTIPALRLGKLRSSALQVTVRKAGSANGGKEREVLLEASVDTSSPYVQAQVVLTLRLLHSVPLREATLGKLEIADAVVEKLGDDVSFQTQRGGKRFEGIERRYALFPQRSGPLTIPPVLLSAKVPDKRARGAAPLDPFGDPFNLLQPLLSVRVRSNEIALNVQPPPAVAQAGAWLPAAGLSLQEKWSIDPPVFRVGEPVTRGLTLRAEGLTAAQLPVLDPGNWDGIKVYTDQPALRNETNGQGIIGASEFKWALVPAREGKLTIPELRVPWWDTKAGAMKTAVLPARTIDVLKAAVGTSPAPAAGAMVQAPASVSAPQYPTPAASEGTPLQPWPLATATLALAWLVTLWLLLRERARLRRMDAGSPAPDGEKISTAAARAAVHQACGRNDMAATRDAILALANELWPEEPPRSLAAVAERVEGLARDALQDLEARLYGTRPGVWNPKAFLKAVTPALKQSPSPRQRRRPDDPLADLIPTPNP